jgi:hypothetical protein
MHATRLFLNPMAKTAWTEREKRKRKTVAKHAAVRAELKKKGDWPNCPAMPARCACRTVAVFRAANVLSSVNFKCLASLSASWPVRV